MATNKRKTKKATKKVKAPVKKSKVLASRFRPRPGAVGDGPSTKAKAPARKGSKAPKKSRRAATKKRVSVRAAAKKAAPVRKAARRAPKAAAAARKGPALRPKSLRRRDGAGHVDPTYASDLLSLTGDRPDEGGSFLERPRARDDLAEALGEGFVEAVTSGEDDGEEKLNEEVPEEQGGPFVETTGAQEFAHDFDPSNPKGAKREPFPTT